MAAAIRSVCRRFCAVCLRCCTTPNCRFIVGLRRCFVKRLPFSTPVLVDSAEVFLYYEKEFCSDVDKTAV